MFPDCPCDQLEGWQGLCNLAASSESDISKLFAREPDRLATLSARCEEYLHLDLSRQSFDLTSWQALCEFAHERKLEQALQSWFYGETINIDERNTAVHQLYRHQSDGSGATSATKDFSTTSWRRAKWSRSAHEEAQRMRQFADKVRAGKWQGSAGKSINCIINVGIGGSHLGIEAAYQSLALWRVPGMSCVFVANIDPLACTQALAGLDLSRTALVISSKSATTLESLRNFATITKAYAERGITDLAAHLFGVTAHPHKLKSLNIPPDQIFTLPENVCGRYSIWSPMAFAIECCIQPEAIREMHRGAALMDKHTMETPLAGNLPVMLALASLWHHGIRGVQQHAILAYSHALRTMVQHLQQLVMESNGKRVTINGDKATASGEIIWGGECSNGQHSYFQLLHQGNQPLHCDVLMVAQSLVGNQPQQDDLLAMALGQTQALTFGNLSPHSNRATCGNIPMSIVLCRQLDAKTFGMLLTLYENRTIAHAILLGINPFDQWGVEFGKERAGVLSFVLQNKEQPVTLDPSTANLVRTMQRWSR